VKAMRAGRVAGPPQIHEIVSNRKRPIPPAFRAPNMTNVSEILSRIMIYYVPSFVKWSELIFLEISFKRSCNSQLLSIVLTEFCGFISLAVKKHNGICCQFSVIRIRRVLSYFSDLASAKSFFMVGISFLMYCSAGSIGNPERHAKM